MALNSLNFRLFSCQNEEMGSEDFFNWTARLGALRFPVSMGVDQVPSGAIGFRVKISPKDDKPWTFFILIPLEDEHCAKDLARVITLEMVKASEVVQIDELTHDFEEDLENGAGVLLYRVENIDDYEWVVCPFHMRN